MNKKIFTTIFIVIFIMTIGYAAVNTNLFIDGSTKISKNLDDFKVYFNKVSINNYDLSATLSEDGQTFNLATNLLNANSENNIEYELINESTQYDVDVNISCTPNANNAVIRENNHNVKAQSKDSNKVNITYDATKNYLYDIISSNSLGTDVENNIDYTQISGTTNGKGIYTLNETKNNTFPINIFRGAIDNNNVIFANTCWKIVRTTDTGGIKIVYNGIPNENNSCSNISENYIASMQWNALLDDNAYIGYMYGLPASNNYNDTHANINNSDIKDTIDTWYKEKLLTYTDYIEDTVWCNDRSIYTESTPGYTLLGYGQNTTLYNAWGRLQINDVPSLICPQANDAFTTTPQKGNGKLTYPVGLLTADEVVYAGSRYQKANEEEYDNSKMYLVGNVFYWTMTPTFYDNANHARGIYLRTNGGMYGSYGNFGVRPAISLINTIAVKSGNGSGETPYILEDTGNVNLTCKMNIKLIERDESAEVMTPEITISNTETYTNEIVVDFSSSLDDIIDKSKTICKYGTTENTFDKIGTIKNNKCILSNLEDNKKYYYQICVNYINNTCMKSYATTQKILNPTILLSSNPNNSSTGYYNNIVANVSYNSQNIKTPYYFIKSGRPTKINEEVVNSCGSDEYPGDCVNIEATNSLEENVWYQVPEEVIITYDDSYDKISSLSAVTYDGNNYSEIILETIDPIYYESTDITYSNSIKPSVANVSDALDDLFEKYY